ncbi:MAG TPA: adenylate/guanylate cyclase domain-containing protein [Candidatus Dormibacteraeota bacterium]
MPAVTTYARSGNVSLAYRVVGEGDVTLVVVPGFVSHLEISLENPGIRRVIERLSRFARVVTFDKRGTGMSDPVSDVPTLEERMDDVRAVMDAAGVERAVLVGVSEGAPMCILFAATYPQRTQALVLEGAMARSTWAEDYPWATPREALLEAAQEFTAPAWGTGENLEVFAPSLADDTAMREWWGKNERMGASPAMMLQLFEMFLETDVRDVLPLVQAPTLVLHRHGDRVVNVGAGRYLADHIEGARFVELPGNDHVSWAGDIDRALDEIEIFITGAKSAPEPPDRILATVLFTDIVGSTERATALGDAAWKAVLERYYTAAREQVERHRGRLVKTTGDGLLAYFDGPGRAIRAAQGMAAASRELGLETRAGLHAGECELLGEDIGGIAVHIGARVAALAGAGEVLVSSTVKDLVAGSGLTFDDRGEHQLKGIEGSWRLFTAR